MGGLSRTAAATSSLVSTGPRQTVGFRPINAAVRSRPVVLTALDFRCKVTKVVGFTRSFGLRPTALCQIHLKATQFPYRSTLAPPQYLRLVLRYHGTR